jgi:hypothetical protein
MVCLPFQLRMCMCPQLLPTDTRAEPIVTESSFAKQRFIGVLVASVVNKNFSTSSSLENRCCNARSEERQCVPLLLCVCVGLEIPKPVSNVNNNWSFSSVRCEESTHTTTGSKQVWRSKPRWLWSSNASKLETQ